VSQPPAARGVIIVFAKAPRPGQVKTRMSPPLTPEQAAGLYSQLLLDVLEVTGALAPRLELEPVLAVSPPEACAELADLAPTPFRVVAQRGASLSQRMAHAVAEAAAGGATRILLRGSDSPLLDESIVKRALVALERVDLAVCPDRDGGFNLIGLRKPAPGIFSHPMSTPSTLGDTLENAASLGLRVDVQEPSFDLDCAGDLDLLARARSAATARLCARTLAYLDDHDLWGYAKNF
jgi:rSAM/selenodomain-associated transferase 1